MKLLLSFFTSIFLAGCSVVGASDVKTPDYDVIASDEEQQIEVRTYKNLVLASTPMTTQSDEDEDRNSAFRVLFNYITGDNTGEQDIAMTAPVMMDKKSEGTKIPMTAPVIMDEKTKSTKIPMTAPVFMDDKSNEPMMSFILPSKYTLETAPKPTKDAVTLSELKDHTVAAIRFSGRMTDKKVAEYEAILRDWINENGYTIKGNMQRAGYDAPFTIPALRRNEVMFEVEK